MYDIDTILDYFKEEDVKFIRLAFVDVYGKQKNVSKEFFNTEYDDVTLKTISRTLNCIYFLAHLHRSMLNLPPRGKKDWKEIHERLKYLQWRVQWVGGL